VSPNVIWNPHGIKTKSDVVKRRGKGEREVHCEGKGFGKTVALTGQRKQAPSPEPKSLLRTDQGGSMGSSYQVCADLGLRTSGGKGLGTKSR